MKWTGKIEERRLELISNGYKYSTIAKILSNEFNLQISRKSVENRSYITKTQIKDMLSCTYKNSNKNELTSFEKNEKLFPEECYELENEFCLSPEKIKKLKELHEMFQKMNIKKILSLSDLHSPFVDFKSVETAVLNNLDADICLLNGDVYDGMAMSRFDKMEEFDIEVEFKQVFKLLNVLTKKFKYVVWVGGNHDMKRFETFVMKNFGPGMRKWVFQRLNPMDYIAEKYSNLIIVPHDWVQIGDTIFSHLQNFSSVEMKTVVTVNDIFHANRKLLPNPDYKAVIIGHTHQCGKLPHNGILLVEQGCLCHMQDYRFQSPTKAIWQKGYAEIYFDNMEINFNKSNVIYL